MLPCGHWCLPWTPPQQCEPQSRAVGACQGLFTDEIWEMCFVSLSISTPMYTIDAFRRRLLCPQVSSHLLAQLTICTLLCGCSWLIMLSAMGQVQLLICIGTVFAAKDTDLYHGIFKFNQVLQRSPVTEFCFDLRWNSNVGSGISVQVGRWIQNSRIGR